MGLDREVGICLIHDKKGHWKWGSHWILNVSQVLKELWEVVHSAQGLSHLEPQGVGERWLVRSFTGARGQMSGEVRSGLSCLGNVHLRQGLQETPHLHLDCLGQVWETMERKASRRPGLGHLGKNFSCFHLQSCDRIEMLHHLIILSLGSFFATWV